VTAADPADRVGPVLDVDEVGDAVLAAIREANADVTVVDRGSYRRVLVAQRCVVYREAIERALGRPFRLPGDLEQVMPSFQGTLELTDERVVWAWRSA
jgi:toluene monooxygenase system protein D